jgi:hypothetical protein
MENENTNYKLSSLKKLVHAIKETGLRPSVLSGGGNGRMADVLVNLDEESMTGFIVLPAGSIMPYALFPSGELLALEDVKNFLFSLKESVSNA